jgi:ParB/RepB/Spo0J family partition protein
MKKFSTNVLSSKASRIAAAEQHTAQIGEQLGTPIRPDEFGHVDRIQVYSIRPDPEQPRRLGVTLEMLRRPEGVEDAKLRERIDYIVALAGSLSEIGQQTPIEVYRDGSVFRLVSGERRWWAAQLAGLETLVAKVLSSRPQDLRLKQFVENAVRAELTPAETLEGLAKILAESADQGKPIETARDLHRRLGLPYSTTHRWWSILKGPQDVIDAVTRRDLPIRVAGEIARIEDAAARAQAITLALAGPAPDAASSTPSPSATRRPGAKAEISLGRTTNVQVARVILQRVLGFEPKGINWKDPAAVSKALRAMLEAVEAELRQK